MYTIRDTGSQDEARTIEAIFDKTGNVAAFMVLRDADHQHIGPGADCKYCPFVSDHPVTLPDNHRHPKGEIEEIFVMPSHRGRGLATEMYNYAVDNGMRPLHSAHRTEDGVGWSQKVGGPFADYS